MSLRWLTLLALCAMLSLPACGRRLTASESDLAARLFGSGLDVAPVRLSETALVGLRQGRMPERPRTTCREQLSPPSADGWITTRTAGVVLGNRINIRGGLMRADFAQAPDGSMNLAAAMFLAHELTHVWQAQNRAVTGYSLWRAGLEHQPGRDPYLFDGAAEARFLDYGYEQQASLVEEYVCCAALDPEGERTGRLRALLAQVMEPGDLPSRAIRAPRADLPERGLCG